MKETFHKLYNTSMYILFDLEQAYYSLEVDEESKKHLGLSAAYLGCFRLEHYPMGLLFSSQDMSYVMRRILKNLDQRFISSNADNILIAADSFENTFKVFIQLVPRIRIGPPKTKIWHKQIVVFWLKITEQSIEVSDKIKKAVRKFETSNWQTT